jgi:hypothetical protein
LSVFLGRREYVVREQANVVYHRGKNDFGATMLGKLVLTNKRVLFFEQKTVKTGGFLGFNQKVETQTIGAKLNAPVDAIVGGFVETRTRKKGSVNAAPSVFSRELFQVLVVSLETENSIENPSFEVNNPQDWVPAIQRVSG